MRFKGAGPPRGFWPVLSAALLILSAVTSYLAPCGFWTNYVFDVPFWHHGDPAGFYFGAAVHFFGPDRSSFGHPGLTLQLFVHLILRGFHVGHSFFGESVAFEPFIAKNIHWLFFICEVAVTALHVLSFYVLYRFARRLLPDRSACLLAVLAYATSFPTLFFLSRISPEPLLVVFFLGTIISVWNLQERAAAVERGKAYLSAVSAALCAAAAFYTKIHLAGLLIPFVFFQILFEKHAWDDAIPRRLRNRLPMAAVFAAGAGLALWVGSLQMSWPVFARFSYEYMPGRDSAASDASGAIAHDYLEAIERTPAYLASRVPVFLRLYTMGSTYEGVFALAEFLFLLCALLGLLLYLRRHPESRSRIAWLAAYWVLMAPVLIHRASFHYYFIPLALASIFMGYLIWEWVARVTRNSERRRFWVSALVTLILHGAAIIFYADTRRQDAGFYRAQWLPYHQALDQLPYGQRIAVVTPDPQAIPPLWHVHGMYPHLVPPATPLPRAFEELFLFTPAAPDQATAAQNRVGVVLSFSPSGPSIERVGER
jgi:hypothetical protein